MWIWQTVFWRMIALSALALALIGVVLPGLPTTPLLLLAAWSGARAWPGLEQRLLAHPSAGPVIRRWRQRRSVPRAAKWLASVMMAISLAVLVLSAAPAWAVGLLAVLFLAVGSWLWSRPDE